MTTKPTSGPLTTDGLAYGQSGAKLRGAGGRLVVSPNGFAETNLEANARLLASAYSSYDRHFADPVAAAEADYLGEALSVLRNDCWASITSVLRNPTESEQNVKILEAALRRIDAVLRQTKEPTA